MVLLKTINFLKKFSMVNFKKNTLIYIIKQLQKCGCFLLWSKSYYIITSTHIMISVEGGDDMVERKNTYLNDTAEHNIETLESLLNEIYTVEIDEEFKGGRTEKVNIVDEIYQINTLSNIYEESLKNHSGKVYDEYSKYLEYTKKYLVYLNNIIKEIELENKDDILNAKRLIEQFKLLLNNN